MVNLLTPRERECYWLFFEFIQLLTDRYIKVYELRDLIGRAMLLTKKMEDQDPTLMRERFDKKNNDH